MIKSPYLAKPGQHCKLKKCSTNAVGHFKDKEEAIAASALLLKRLSELQEKLYAGRQHAVLIVLQAMDAGGKDGTISHVFGGVNPQGCSVTSFKVPTPLEASHDFLWRHHLAAPEKGMIGIFNRSHYESVLIERVAKLVPDKVWKRRYDSINQFEKMLAEEGTTILKFFLHISKDEQKERLQARLDDKTRHWKFDPHDLDVRKQWNAYQHAYADAITECSTEQAPWYVVPADHKWFRNWVIADVLVRTLESLDLEFPAPEPGLQKLGVR